MTFSMIKRGFFMALALLCMDFALAQNVQYYKLTRKIEKGKSSENVTGGQFITFLSDKCFESTKSGVGVNHGTLKRNKSYSNAQQTVYQGSSYWGSNTTFIFNADKSVLNVVLENDDKYIYKRATPPSGQTTCSLIRKNGSSGNTAQPYYGGGNNYGNCGNYGGGNYGNSGTQGSNESPSQQHGYVTETYQDNCPVCYGTGKCQNCYGRGTYNDYTNTTRDCPSCVNGNCSKCGGSGKVTKTRTVWK